MIRWVVFGVLWLFMCTPLYAQSEAPDQCVACHMDLDEEGLSWLEDDIHTRKGLSCVSCHGGNASTDDMDAAKGRGTGFRGAPSRSSLPEFCGRCHQDASYMRQYNPGLRVDQLDLYRTSVHGQKLRGGDENVAVCTDCHDHHGILPASDARSWVYASNIPGTCGRCHSDAALMADYGIPTDQYEKFQRSVHGHLLLERGSRSRGAPSCNVCHGNHGAAPPGVSSVSNVCGQCHPINADLLSRSPHAGPFEMMGVAACESCHGHHEVQSPSDDMLGTGEASVCIECHEADSNGYLTSVAMQGVIVKLQERHNQAEALIGGAERAGMEVRDALFQLKDVENQLVKARATVHAFSLSQLEAVIATGDSLASVAVGQGEQALAELQFRRMGLGVSLLIIVIVGVALFIKIREEDERRGLK